VSRDLVRLRRDPGRSRDVRIALSPVKGSEAPKRPCPRCPGQLSEGKLPGSGGLLLTNATDAEGSSSTQGELRRCAATRPGPGQQRPTRTHGPCGTSPRRRGAISSAIDHGRQRRDRARLDLEPQPGVVLLDLPIEEDSSSERTPYALFSLVGLLAAIWLWQLAGRPKAVWARLAAVPSEIAAGQHPYTLLTAAFIHGGWLHILGNLYFLWTFGDNVRGSGRKLGVPGVVRGVGPGGSVAFVVMARVGEQGVPGLARRGAISGVSGAYLVLFSSAEDHGATRRLPPLGPGVADPSLVLPRLLGRLPAARRGAQACPTSAGGRTSEGSRRVRWWGRSTGPRRQTGPAERARPRKGESMDLLPTIREMFDHSYWARDQQLRACAGLDASAPAPAGRSFSSLHATARAPGRRGVAVARALAGPDARRLIPARRAADARGSERTLEDDRGEMRGYLAALDERRSSPLSSIVSTRASRGPIRCGAW